jgi:hypothetical protein
MQKGFGYGFYFNCEGLSGGMSCIFCFCLTSYSLLFFSAPILNAIGSVVGLHVGGKYHHTTDICVLMERKDEVPRRDSLPDRDKLKLTLGDLAEKSSIGQFILLSSIRSDLESLALAPSSTSSSSSSSSSDGTTPTEFSKHSARHSLLSFPLLQSEPDLYS